MMMNSNITKALVFVFITILGTAMCLGQASKEIIEKMNTDTIKTKKIKKTPQKGPLRFVYEEGKDSVYHGTMWERQVCESSVKMVNDSNVDQKITSIQPTCVCVELIDPPAAGTIIKPGEALEIKYRVLAGLMQGKSFRRYFVVESSGNPPARAHLTGVLKKLVSVEPERSIDLPAIKNPATPWEVVYTLTQNPEYEGKLVLGQMPEDKHLKYELTQLSEGKFQLRVTPKNALPYSHKYIRQILIPVEEPAQAVAIDVSLNIQVAEPVNFAPDVWNISRPALEEAKTFTASFVYGEVPGIQEENIEKKETSGKVMTKELLSQHNSIPLKYVKENHDWDDLFAHLEFKVPEGLKVEKIRHPQGIELRVTVTAEALAGVDKVEIVPYRDGNLCSPITINVVNSR